MTDLSARPAISTIQPADYQRVVEVWEASVRATHDFVSEADIQVFRPLVRDGLPDVTYLLGERDDDGQVVGFIGVVGEKIEMLFIHPDWRGQGIGGRLLTHVVMQLGAMLVDVNEQNAQAVGFYQHFGFEVIGRSDLDGTNKPYPLLHMQHCCRQPPERAQGPILQETLPRPRFVG